MKRKKPTWKPEGYICPHCDSKFQTAPKMGSHKRWCSQNPNRGSHRESGYNCEYCKEHFETSMSLAIHTRWCPKNPNQTRELNERPEGYDCHYCNEHFPTLSLMLGHTSTCKILQKKSYQCPHCQKLIISSMSLASHIRWCRKNPDRDYKDLYHQCRYCDKIFNSQISLGAHLRICTQNTNMICKHCNKTFDDRLSRNGHMLQCQANPDYEKNRPSQGTRGNGSYYRGVWMHSAWERTLAERFDELGIKWERKKMRSFPYETQNGNERQYFPDFYLPSLKIFVEVKGRWTIKETHKICAALKQNDDLNLLILDSLSLIKKFDLTHLEEPSRIDDILPRKSLNLKRQ